MGVNLDRPHVYVLPEDDADRQVAKGFHLQLAWNLQRQMQVLQVAGGWIKVLTLFADVHVTLMDRVSNRFMILLFDFDNVPDRLEIAKRYIPQHLADRVFILGSLIDPEALRPDLGPPEAIGLKLAQDCREETDDTWSHSLLRHNAGELDRLRERVRPILFP